MAGYGVDLVNCTGVDLRASIHLLEVSSATTGECGRHEKIAGKEHHEGDKQPLSTYKHNGVYLKPPFVSYSLQKFLRIHLNEMID